LNQLHLAFLTILNHNSHMENEITTEPEKKPAHRPTLFTMDLADKICEKVSEELSMRTICLADEFPEARTIYRWLRQHEEFRQQYAHAKAEAAEAFGEEILDIADDGSNDWMEVRNKKGDIEIVLDKEHVMRSRLRIDTRKWLMEKLKPKKYGLNPVGVQMMDKDGNPADPMGGAAIDLLAAALENVKNGKERGEKVERELENQRTGPL